MVDASALKSGNILGGMGINTSSFDLGTIGTIFLWGLGFIIVALAIIGVVIWFINKRSYIHQIWVFKRVGGVPMLQFIDKAKNISFGMAGDKLIQLKKYKKFLPPPTIQMGKNIFWYWEREDGEFINFSLQDIDEMQKKAGAYYVDTDMRMQRLGIEKNLKERLDQQSWFAKYGSTVAGVIFVIMVTVALVVLFANIKDVATSIDNMASSVNAMAQGIEKYYDAREGSLSPNDAPKGGSGLVPAFVTLLLYRRKKWRE